MLKIVSFRGTFCLIGAKLYHCLLSHPTHVSSSVNYSALYLFQQSDKGNWRWWCWCGNLPFSSFFILFVLCWSTRVSSVFLWSSFWLYAPRVSHQRASFSVISFFCLPLEAERRHARWANDQAGRPPLHRCTSWWQCWGSVWPGGWLGRGTALCIPPPWVPSAEFGRKSGTCCPPLVAWCVSPLQFESGRKACSIHTEDQEIVRLKSVSISDHLH